MPHRPPRPAPRRLRGTSNLLALVGLCCAVAASAVFAQPAPAVATAAPPVKQYPLRDFFRNPDKGYFRLSEGGTMLGFMQPWSADAKAPKRMNIYVQQLDGSKPVGEPRRVTAEAARDIANY
ncbi:MAG: hypothetical protein KGJ44_09155, partial [Betaproteobacteria bacterium]|nr:hypothetical protein [Betaproteobacteria bacterium]